VLEAVVVPYSRQRRGVDREGDGRERPSVVVSTGAAPGYLAIRCARLMGARTLWIDSVANIEELSMSGRLASTTADLCLTQWPHLADERIRYLGAVL